MQAKLANEGLYNISISEMKLPVLELQHLDYEAQKIRAIKQL